MLSKINTSSMNSPDRPSRRPHGPRSACSPALGSARSATRAHYHDAWKTKAGSSKIRTSPPQTSLPYDAVHEQDPLFNILVDQSISQAPRRYHLKLVDIDPLSSDDDSPFDSLFSFTASPVESPSYAATTFAPRQPTRPAPLSLHKHSYSDASDTSCYSDMSFFSPLSPEFVVRPFSYGGGDRVDRWIHGGGLEPLMTPMVVDHKSHEHWDEGGQSDWREIIDQFLQHADGDTEEPLFPPTPRL
ncbi:hypothetical protein K466DRAFT_500745 [Polyporus arcularius HHB13444]|uniref:Uncharacterized protein n=1 Tax=Polyporus arcularius HHB13444 TaxID=1314778 RepID=A0A5C3P0Q4_9APHY|nr:hypothetical protein K466DRAFT_500745 [Polyporus arcularius HHB13444]